MMSNPPFVYQPRIKKVDEQAQQQIYTLLCQGVPAVHIARRFSISTDIVTRLRRSIGITTHYGRRWTQQEDWELQALADQSLHINKIAKRLHRTSSSVQHRMRELGIQRIQKNTHTYTLAQVSRILQVGIGSVGRWVSNGLLRASLIRMLHDKKRRGYHRIDALDLYDFLANPRHWHLYRLEHVTDEFLRRDLVAVHRETPRWLYVRDLAERFTVSDHAVLSWCSLGKIPYEVIMKTCVFDPEKLRDWVPPYGRSTPYKYGSKVLKRAISAYPDLLTAKQVAERYGYKVGTVNEWARDGIIPACVQVGRYRLFDPEQLANWTPPNRIMNTQPVRKALAERPDLLTTNDVAERYGVNRTTVHDWHGYGWITGVKVGRILMFEPEQFIDWEPPYVRRRKNAAYRPTENGDRPSDDRTDDGRRLAGGGATGEWAAETDPQPGGGCESSALPELAQEAA